MPERERDLLIALLMVAMVVAGSFAVQTYTWTIPYQITGVLTWTQTTTADFDSATRKVHVDTANDELKLASFENVKAMVIYYDATAGVTRTRYRTWEDNAATWSDEGDVGSDDNRGYWQRVVSGTVRKNEKISGTDNNSHVIVRVWRPSTWDNELILTGDTTETARNFDIAYEENSGDALLVWGDGTATAKYKIWNGSSWVTPENENVLTSASTIVWVALAPQRGSDNIMVVTVDALNELKVKLWNGDSWVGASENKLTDEVQLRTTRVFDVTWDNSGRCMVAWGDGASAKARLISYVIWDGSSWSAVAEVDATPMTGLLRWVRLAADPNSSRIMLGAGDNESDFKTWIWHGAAPWDNRREHSTGLEVPAGGTRQPWDIAWEGKSGHALIVWANLDDDNMYADNWIDGRYGASPVKVLATGQTDPQWLRLERDPNSNEIMAIGVDDGEDVFWNRWTGSSWVAGKELETSSAFLSGPHFDVSYTDSSGYLISSSCDSGSTLVDWENISWAATVSPPGVTGTTLKFRTRVSTDNATWSAWSDWYTSSPSVITSPDNHRYLQYQAWLETDNIANTPVVDNVSITYVP